MSDAPPEEAPADEHAAAGKPKKQGGTSPIVMALLVLNLGASGFGAFKIMTASPASAATAPEHHEEKSGKEITGPVLPLEPFVVNLDEPGNARYLKMKVQLELTKRASGGSPGFGGASTTPNRVPTAPPKPKKPPNSGIIDI